jgi:hypothetical protein
MTRVISALLLAAALTSSCTGTTSMTPNLSETPNVTGTWSGNLSVDTTTARMVWTLSQTSTHVTGSALLALPTGTVLLNGVITGELVGSTLTYTIAIGPGAIPSQPTCTGELGGTMNVTSGTTPTLAGNFVIRNSTCTPPFAGGNLTLTKQ